MTRTADPSPADAVTPEQAARFAAALDRLLPQGGRPGLAVSGGPDSLAMLLLALAAIPGGFEVATVDHGLRPEAQEESDSVAATSAARRAVNRSLRPMDQKYSRVQLYIALSYGSMETLQWRYDRKVSNA